MKYGAVLFDLDGTLLDTIEDLSDSMNAALGQLGLPPRTAAECKLFVGEGVEIFARRSLPEARRDRQTISHCVELMRSDYAQRWAVKTRPYAGIPELLDGLAAHGLTLAVLSNKPDDTVQEMISHFFADGQFRLVRGARPDMPRKPDPAVALEISDQLNVPPAQFLYLGDTDVDMKTANAGGMYAVGALWGFRPADELIQHGARSLIDHPAELLKLI